jgi:translation initiation factor 1
MNSNYKTVYSTDPKDQVYCEKCKKHMEECRCPQLNALVDLKKVTVNFRLESNGRGGKTVTVLDDLPKNEPFLKELTKELKVKCGTGGTYKLDQKSGRIEIQGDKRVAIKAILDKKQIKYKGF